jgi:hypothetical protein
MLSLYKRYVCRGQAAFQGLYIKRAAANYAIRFVAFDNSGIGVAWVDSKLFTVVPGAAYQIGLQDNVGTMYGGGTFDTAVRVALQDRGGHSLTDVTAGTVTCTLTAKPRKCYRIILNVYRCCATVTAAAFASRPMLHIISSIMHAVIVVA